MSRLLDLADIVKIALAASAGKLLLIATTKDMTPCRTRIKTGRGIPFSQRLAVHPMPNGKTEIKALRDSPPPSVKAKKGVED